MKRILLASVAAITVLALIFGAISLYPEFHVFPEGDLVLYYGEVMTRQQLRAESYNAVCTPLYLSTGERLLRQLASHPTFICFASSFELENWRLQQGLSG